MRRQIPRFPLRPEWALLAAVIPLLRREPTTTAANDLLFLFFWFALVACLAFRKRIPAKVLRGLPICCLLPVVGLSVSQAGARLALGLVSLWVALFAFGIIRRPSRDEVVSRRIRILLLVSIALTLGLLVCTHVLFRIVSPRAFQGRSLSGAVLLLIGISAFAGFAVLRWWREPRRDLSVVWVTLLILTVLLVSEGRHDVRVWLGVRKARSLEASGKTALARQLLSDLFTASSKKGVYSLYPDLLLIQARLDIDEGFVGSAVGSLIWIAEHVPEKTSEALELLDGRLIGALRSLPEEERGKYPLFSDFEYDPKGGFFLLDRWGRLFHRASKTAPFEPLYTAPIPPGRFAADFERVADGGLILDDYGEIYPVGDVGEDFKAILAHGYKHVRDAVDLEIAASGNGFYIQNAYGGVVCVGETRLSEDQIPHHWNYRIIKTLALLPDDRGALLLDGRGGLHAVRDVPFDPTPPQAPYWPDDRAADVEIVPSGNGAILMSWDGDWAVFGETPWGPDPHPLPNLRGCDLEISPDGIEVAVLAPDGDIQIVPMGPAGGEETLDSAKKAAQAGDYAELWTVTVKAVEYDPTCRGKAMALFDKDFYAKMRRCDKTTEFHKGVLRDLKRRKGKTFVLDAWAQVWTLDDKGHYSLSTVFDTAAREWAMDLEWDPSSESPIVLTDRGRILEKGPAPTFLKQNALSGALEKAVDLEIDWNHRTAYILDAYGEIHPVSGEAKGGGYDFAARWDTEEAIDLALLGPDGGMAILDRFGGIHTVGNVPVDTMTKDAPYWSIAKAARLLASPGGDSLAVLSINGEFFPFGKWREEISRFRFPDRKDPWLINGDYDPDENSTYLLGWNGEVTAIPMDERIGSFWMDRADAYLKEGKASEAVDAVVRAVHSAPDKAAQTLQRAGPEFIKKVARNSLVFPDQSGLIVDALPHFERGELWLLDRFGRILRWSPKGYEVLVEEPVPFRKDLETRAVAFARLGNRFLVLDSNGILTVHWPGGMDRDGTFAGTVSKGFEPSDILAVGNGALLLDQLGGIQPYGPVDMGTLRFPKAKWDFPIARKLARIGNDIYVLDGFGGIHGPDGAPKEMLEGACYFAGIDLVRDFAPDRPGKGFHSLDFAGRITNTMDAGPKIPNWALPSETVELAREARAFEEKEKRRRRNIGLAEPDFEKNDFRDFDGSTALVFDPRDDSLYIVFESGRVSFIRWNPESAEDYRGLAKEKQDGGDLEGAIREYTRAIGVGGSPSVFTEFDQGIGAILSKAEIPVLRHYRDLLPGEQGQACVLDEWGRVFRWDEGVPLAPLYPEPIVQKDGRPDGSAAFRRDETGGFVILTSDGDLHLRGKVAPWVSAIVQSWTGDFPYAVDFVLDPKTQSILIASSHGQVVRVSSTGRELVNVLDTYWEDDVIKSMAVTEDGISLYDHLGGIHGSAVSKEIRERSVYIPEPLMTDLWVSEQGDGAAALRVDGTVFLLGDLDRGLWDRRFLPWAATEPVTTYEALGEAARLRFSPAVDIEVLPDEAALFVLRGNGDVIRIWKNEKAATRCVDEAKAALGEKNLSAALQDLDRAFMFYPPCAERIPAEPGMEPAGWVYSATIGESTPVSLFVDFLPGAGTDASVLLDRWGRLFEANQEGFRRMKPPTEVSVSGTNAVGLVSGQSGEYVIGYRNGVIETWGNGERKEFLRVDLQPNDDMVSLEALKGSAVLFAASSRGKIYRIDLRNRDVEPLVFEGWEFPFVIGYLPESETAGYLLDVFGRVYSIGKCRIFTRYTEGEPGPEWKRAWGSDLAILPEGNGLVLLDKFGGLHPLGGELPQDAFTGLPYFQEPYPLKLHVTDNRFFIMDGNGRVYVSQD